MRRRTALVTGASRGIGLGIASYLASHGYDLTISARDEDRLNEAAADLRALGARVRVVAADMSKEDDVLRLPSEPDGHSGPLDVLVLAAGVGTASALDGYPMRRFDKQLSVNLRAPFVLLSALLPMLRAAAQANPGTGAKVIALASIGGVYPEPGLSAYGAAKAALTTLCQSVNVEESRNGITACALSPAYVDTDMSTWVHETVQPESMISVDDIVTMVGALLRLSANAVVPHIVINRASDNLYRA